LPHKQTIVGKEPAAQVKTHFVKIKTTAAVLFGFLAPLSAGSAPDVHPIIEIETGYFFGGSDNGKWIKADQAANRLARRRLTKFTA